MIRNNIQKGKNKWRLGLFCAVLLFILLRLVFLFLTPYVYYNEEAKQGSLGHDLLFEGRLRLPLWGYMDTSHSGGSLFVGITAIPFYMLLGNRYLALKMTALFFSLITSLLFYRLLIQDMKDVRKNFFPFFVLLFSFATPHYLQKSVILTGNMGIFIFFTTLSILFFQRIENIVQKSKVHYFFLGVLCGFSLWIQFMSIYLVITIGLYSSIFVIRKKWPVSSIGMLICGIFVGLTPLWIYNIQYHWITFSRDIGHIRMIPLVSFTKLWKLLSEYIPASFHFLSVSTVKGRYIGYVFFGLILLTMGIHFVQGLQRIKTKENDAVFMPLFLTTYIIIIIIGTSILDVPVTTSDYLGWNSMANRAEYYIVFLQPLFLILILLLFKYKKKISLAINCIIAVFCLLGFCMLFTQTQFNSFLFEPMHSTEANAFECGFHFVVNEKLFHDFEKKVPTDLKCEYAFGAGVDVHYDMVSNEALLDNTCAFYYEKGASPEVWDAFIKGVLIGDVMLNEDRVDYNDVLVNAEKVYAFIKKKKLPGMDIYLDATYQKIKATMNAHA